MQDIITIEQCRDEGIPSAQADDGRLALLIRLVQQYISLVTGNIFTKENLTLLLDGPGTPTLFLPVPIIDLTSLSIIDEEGVEELLAPAYYKVYNRTDPLCDDRKNPKIVRVRGFEPRFPEGRQNIKLIGNFGYVELDAEAEEDWRTPDPIQRAAIMLIIRELDLLANENNRAKKDRSRITSESAQGHSYSLATLAIKGGITGDWEIDTILALYRRPIAIGVV